MDWQEVMQKQMTLESGKSKTSAQTKNDKMLSYTAKRGASSMIIDNQNFNSQSIIDIDQKKRKKKLKAAATEEFGSNQLQSRQTFVPNSQLL